MRVVLDFPPSLCVVAKLFHPHEDVSRSTLHADALSRNEMSKRGNSICADESAFSTVKFRRGEREKIWDSALKSNSKLSQRRVCACGVCDHWHIGILARAGNIMCSRRRKSAQRTRRDAKYWLSVRANWLLAMIKQHKHTLPLRVPNANRCVAEMAPRAHDRATRRERPA